VRLSAAVNTSIGMGTNTVTITDEDASTVGFAVAAISVAESINSVAIIVVRTGATNTAVSVSFTNLASSTAAAGSDFIATNGVLTFAPGVATNTFSVSILNDAVAENNEYINLRLQNPTNTTLGVSNLVVTITTNDSAVLSWSTVATNVAEAGGTLTLTVNRTGTTNNAVSVDFATADVTAAAGTDYSATNGSLSFAGGETSKTITVDISDDDLQEGNETFRVVLSNPADATLGVATNTVTITDDDAGSVTLSTGAVTVAEAAGSVTIVVLRTGATNTAVAVSFTTTNGSATAGSDYTGTNGTLVFSPGETSNSLTLAIAADLIYESTETFRFVLSGITNSSLAIGTNTVSITDDDYAALGFTAASADVSELDGSVTISVERTGATNTAVSVAFATADATATAGADYTATNGVLTFAPGETNKDINILVAFDDDLEPSETFLVRLSSFNNVAPAVQTNLTVTIGDGFGGNPAGGAVVSIASFTKIGPDTIRLHIVGPDGAVVVIEATSDFRIWSGVATNVITGGGFDWLAPIDRAAQARGFRVARPTP